VFVDDDLGAATQYPCSENRVTLLSCALPASSPSSIRYWRLLPLSGGVACAFKTRLRQFRPVASFIFIYSVASNLFSTLRLVWYFDYVVTTMSRTPLQLCIGCVYHNVHVDFKVTVMAFRCYMSWSRATISESDGSCRRRPVVAATSVIVTPTARLVPSFRLTTVGRRTFQVAASLVWNLLPSDIQASSSLCHAFHQRLKTFLFRQSFPDIYTFITLRPRGLRNSFAISPTLKKFFIDIDVDIVTLTMWLHSWKSSTPEIQNPDYVCTSWPSVPV